MTNRLDVEKNKIELAVKNFLSKCAPTIDITYSRNCDTPVSYTCNGVKKIGGLFHLSDYELLSFFLSPDSMMNKDVGETLLLGLYASKLLRIYGENLYIYCFEDVNFVDRILKLKNIWDKMGTSRRLLNCHSRLVNQMSTIHILNIVAVFFTSTTQIRLRDYWIGKK